MVEKELMYNYKLFIPTAGIGSRVSNFARNMNKGLIGIDNKPVLSHIVEKFHPKVDIVVALGYGSIYNHSNEPNAYWMSLNDRRTFLFIANRDIEPGEEIFTYYGDVNYWNDGRSNIEIKWQKKIL